MVWSVKSTRSASFHKTINAPVDAVLELVQNPDVLLTLSPLVMNVSPDPLKPSTYIITERLVALGCIPTSTTFSCTLTMREDGVDTDVVAGVGTRLNGSWRVKAGENGTTELTEEVTVKGISFLMPFIFNTMSGAHLATVDRFAAKAENTPSRFLEFLATLVAVADVHNRQVATMDTPLGPDAESSHILHFVTATLLAFGAQYLYPATSHTIPILTFIGALSVLYFLNMTNDPYGLFHLSLNKLPNEDPNVPPATEWLNMGYWQNTDIFPEACKALALKLVRAANIKDGGRILDVGHGTGESLILLLTDPTISRPSSITGITSLRSHHLRSQARVNQLRSLLKDPKPAVVLYAGDAIYDPTALGHPLDPSYKKMFDTILALDCAYHFNTRRTFLKQSFQKLSPGGRIALADICFDPNTIHSLRVTLITRVLRLMPLHNVVSSDDYVSMMKEIGYIDVQLKDITSDVLPGFILFLKSRGQGWKVFGLMMEMYLNGGVRFVIVSGTRV